MSLNLSDAEPGDTAIVAWPIERVEKLHGIWCKEIFTTPDGFTFFTKAQIRTIEKGPKPLKVGDAVDIGDLYWHGLPVDGMTREQLLVVVKRLMTKDILPTA